MYVCVSVYAAMHNLCMCIAHGSETVRQGCEEHLAHQPSHAGLVALSVLPALASR